jgi:3-phenylpropionate/trans-cinnamate dioxygenase ferredoxin reductase subunit
LVNSIKSIAAGFGAVCYADPFLPTTDDPVEESALTRAMGWLSLDRPRKPRARRVRTYKVAEARVRSHYRPQRA